MVREHCLQGRSVSGGIAPARTNFALMFTYAAKLVL